MRSSHDASRLIADILRHARAQTPPIPAGELARRVGISPETLSRMKRYGRGDIAVIADLAAAVGLRLTLTGTDVQVEKLRSGTFFDD